MFYYSRFCRERFDTDNQIIDESGMAFNRTQLDTGWQGGLEWPNEGVKIVRLKRRTFKYGVKKEDRKVRGYKGKPQILVCHRPNC